MKFYLAILLVLFPFTSIHAETTMGRLFFTQIQRDALDKARQQNLSMETTNNTPEDSITLNGVVKRSDGRHTVWINNKTFDEGINIKRDSKSGNYNVQLPYSEQHVRLKVGQRLDSASGKIEEAYRRKAALTPTPDKPVEPSPIRNNPSPSTKASNDKNGPDEPAQ